MTRAAPDLLATACDLLADLVGFDTVSSKSNLALVDHVEAYLGKLGIESLRVPNAEGDKAAILASVGPKVDGGIVLSGHTDVVPVEGQDWSADPFALRESGGRLYGRGACDMKGFDALCLAMMPVFAAAELKKPIHLLLSYDEEIGCLGSLDTIAKFGHDLPKPAIAIVGEPTQMRVVDAHKSIASFVTTVHGKEAHSSDPEAGASAIEAAAALIGELYAFQRELERDGDASGLFQPPYSTVHVGTIVGGNARNILAKTCRFAWEFRGLPGTDPKAALQRLERFAEASVLPRMRRTAPDARIETRSSTEVPGLAADPGSAAETLVKALLRTNEVSTVSFATEAGQFQKNGISTIVCGPGSIAQAHQPDEYIEISQLEAGLAFLQRLGAHLSA